MADWRQIQARIRKAKASTDPAEKLAELHQHTHDAMVAFELARLHEKTGDNAEAAKWYTTAAQQFRRAQWRVKAEEALARLGADIPPRTIETDLTAAIEESTGPREAQPEFAAPPAARLLSAEWGAEEVEKEENEEEIVVLEKEEIVAEADVGPGASAGAEASATAGAGRRRRRRGRRGGRKHRRAGAPAQEPEKMPAAEHGGRERAPAHAARSSRAADHSASHVPSQAPASGAYHRPSVPEPPARRAAELEPAAEAAYVRRSEPDTVPGRTRAAEPALSSRMAQLESRLRRLLACPLALLVDAEQAPAGPGVLLLSDSDQVTHYYVESCQTLRIGIANLLRGGRGSKEAGRLKPALADNLGISESSVSKYLKDHCVVRWLQLDEGAPELAHFAIAVLRPVVNE